MDTAATQPGHDREPDRAGGSADGHERELTITIPLDRAIEVMGEPLAAAARVLSARGGLPIYVGLGVMAAADVLAWPVAAAAGLGYAVLRRLGPLQPPPARLAADEHEPGALR